MKITFDINDISTKYDACEQYVVRASSDKVTLELVGGVNGFEDFEGALQIIHQNRKRIIRFLKAIEELKAIKDTHLDSD